MKPWKEAKALMLSREGRRDAGLEQPWGGCENVRWAEPGRTPRGALEKHLDKTPATGLQKGPALKVCGPAFMQSHGFPSQH